MGIRHAEVLFPTSGADGKMNRIRVTAYPDRHNGMRSCPYASKAKQVKHLLGYCRDGEDIETLDIDVVVQFDNDVFEGQSFGLALALADKRARFIDNDLPALVCATGIISNKGRVLPVDHIKNKVALVANELPPGSFFVFPIANRQSEPDAFCLLESKELTLIGVDSLGELASLWEDRDSAPANANQAVQISSPNWIWLAMGTALGFLITIGIAFSWVSVRAL